MKKIALLSLIFVMLVAFSGCGNDNEVPEGMQLVRGGEEEGYYFYAPEEWTVANVGEVAAAYASNVNTTSVTFAEIDEASFKNDSEGVADSDYFLYEYFNDNKHLYPADTVYGAEAEERILGSANERADIAVVYTYSYKYNDVSYGFMQYFAVHDGRYYILTYSAINEVIEGFEESRYDTYLEKFTSIVENFRFVDKKAADEKNPAGAPDEYRLVSDKGLCGFELYAPYEFALDYSSAIVSLSTEDGSSICLTEATGTGTSVAEYMLNRQHELEQIVTDFKWITPLKEVSTVDGGSVMAPEGTQATLGNLPKRDSAYNYALAFEYTYVFNGESYHVYQIAASDFMLLSGEGYVFTYTAKAENYDEHLPTVMEIIDRIVF